MSNPITLKIEHKKDYCILIMALNENKHREINLNDIMFSLVMLGNFFNNVKKQNLKFILVFDTRKVVNLGFLVMNNVTSFFIKNKDILESNAIGSCIYIEDLKGSNKLISFLSKIYKPVRPVGIINNDLNRDTFIKDCVENTLENKVYVNKYYND